MVNPTTLVVIDTDCTGSGESNYHTTTTTAAPNIDTEMGEEWDNKDNHYWLPLGKVWRVLEGQNISAFCNSNNALPLFGNLQKGYLHALNVVLSKHTAHLKLNNNHSPTRHAYTLHTVHLKLNNNHSLARHEYNLHTAHFMLNSNHSLTRHDLQRTNCSLYVKQ